MISYKQIIKNMVEYEVEKFINKRSGRYGNIKELTIEKLDSQTLHFIVKADVNYNTFEIGGIIDEFGNITIGHVSRDGMRCTEKDASGEWITESAKPFHEFICGDALKTYAF